MKHELLWSAPPVLREFLTYNEAVKNKSDGTIDEYYLDLQTFFRYLKQIRGLVSPTLPFEEIPIEDVDIDLIRSVSISDLFAFMAYCRTERDNNPTTRARKTSCLRVFFKYLANQHLISVNPAEQLETPKLKKSLPKHLSLEQSRNLLEAVDGPFKERDYCILTFFLNCGIRLSELCGLNLSDIGSDHSMRVLGKGNKERIVYLNQACLDALNAYLPTRPVDGVLAADKNALFLSRLKRRISHKTVQHIVYTYLEKAGLGGQGLSTHKLRHTAATLMYQHGHVDIRVLKDILGHENLGTTQIYTHVSDEQVKNAIEANPLSQVKPPKPRKKDLPPE